MNFKTIGVLVLLAAAASLLFLKQPTVEQKAAELPPGKQKLLSDRQVQIDPAELLELMNNNQINLRIIDVRDESDFNLFHFIDAKLVTEDQLKDPLWIKDIPTGAVKVLVSNDEEAATEAWKLLVAQGVINIYILEGGVNNWLNVYGRALEGGGMVAKARTGVPEGSLRFVFPAALGARHPLADPDPHKVPEREFEKKVKVQAAVKKGGGCG